MLFQYVPNARFALDTEDTSDNLSAHKGSQCPPNAVEGQPIGRPKSDQSHTGKIGQPHGNHGEVPIQTTHDNPIDGIGQSLEHLCDENGWENGHRGLAYIQITRESLENGIPLQISGTGQ
eukprot:scaffold31669_cov59-Attheya_sp.AAC.2